MAPTSLKLLGLAAPLLGSAQYVWQTSWYTQPVDHFNYFGADSTRT